MKPSLDGTSTKLVPLCSSQKVVSYVIFWQTKVTWFLLSSSENWIFAKFSSLNMARIDLVIPQILCSAKNFVQCKFCAVQCKILCSAKSRTRTWSVWTKTFGPQGPSGTVRPMDSRFEPDLEDSVAHPWQLTIQSSNSLVGYWFHFWIFLFQFSIGWQAFDFLHSNLWFHQSSLNFELKVHHKIFLHQRNLKWFSGGIISQMIKKCCFLFSELDYPEFLRG